MSDHQLPKKVHISKETIKRLVTDVRQIMKHPLHDNGIYYQHDQEDMLKGRAVIIGPKDTPYQYGYYLFYFKFPDFCVVGSSPEIMVSLHDKKVTIRPLAGTRKRGVCL